MANQGSNADLVGRPGSRALLATPALVVDLDALGRNIRKMADFCRDNGVALRPHAKTHKSARIARLQVAAGALGACAATLGEAEALVDGGIAGVLISSPVVQPSKIERLMALDARAGGLMVVADNPDNVDALAAAAAAARPLRAAVDLDMCSQRSGVPDADAGVALARRIDGAAGLEFAGVQAYAGSLQHIADFAERQRRAAEINSRVAELKDKLAAAGLRPGMVSGAGTGTHFIDGRGGDYTELQAGSYIFTDVEYNAVVLREDEPRPFEAALFVQATVISTNAPGFVTTDAGTKRFAMGCPPPEVVSGAPPGSTYGFMGDEHGKLVLGDASRRPPLGATVTLLTPHCDPTVNLYDLFHVVRGDTLVDIWPVDARGAI